jgi:hypothetical protein
MPDRNPTNIFFSYAPEPILFSKQISKSNSDLSVVLMYSGPISIATITFDTDVIESCTLVLRIEKPH